MRVVIAVVLATITLGLAHGPLQTYAGQEPLRRGWLFSLRMFDSLNGWARSAEGWGGVGAKGAVSSVVHTTDGGLHWKDVTPLRPLWRMGWLASQGAWVLATSDSTSGPETAGPDVLLFHTVDGGQTWKRVTVPLLGIMDFINSRDGWLRVGAGDVYRSNDGGETWTKIGSAEFPGATETSPITVESMTFLSATTGVIMGRSDAHDGIYLLVTRDAGHSWQQRRLPLPPQLTNLAPSVMPPTFLTARDGILPVLYGGTNDAGVLFYITRDGGKTWKDTTPVALESYRTGAGALWSVYRSSSFTDLDHGWVTDGDSLYVTSNGGRQWTNLRPGPPFEHMQELSFISAQIGWAAGQALWPPVLLRTDDGGRRWAPLPYAISPP